MAVPRVFVGGVWAEEKKRPESFARVAESVVVEQYVDTIFTLKTL